ncbi:hypothetical protein APR04_003123 [Promicromonospora umidemergens]|uniref:Surface-anchored protein n=1 Tax=Promicromonospora umidemergens TaxID=629679 RepID=A0ABP8XXU3_9MICO|nr:hypothetical protein [Promicromonospora umidemergens]MCP2284203.1 hypothetical protein [Promicromonospora umidemergens]
MMNRHTTQRIAAAAASLAVATVGGLATTAMAAEGDDTGVGLSVTIEDNTPGALSMSVAPNDGVVLAEEGSDAEARQFVGSLPTVTVADTRDAEDVPEGSYWAVVGQASEFTAEGREPIGPEYLGWAPRLLTPSPSGDIAAGEPVSSVLPDGSGGAAVGLEGQELLLSTWAAGSEAGPWDVTADLTLRTPADVPPGEYSSVLTLSLFEG